MKPAAKGAVKIKKLNFSKANLFIFVLIFAAVGGWLIYKSQAAGLLGDINNDGVVSQGDITILAANFNTSYAAADVNHDGIVNYLDVSIVLSHFGETSSQPLIEIATEQTCPNQTNNSVSDAIKYTAMVCMTNNARAFNGGLRPLALESALVSATPPKADDIINCNDFSHTACGRAFDYWIKLNNYSGFCWGENIAYGYANVHDTFVAWMNSPGHRANILNGNYSDIGLAWNNWAGHGALWVENLGGCR